MWLTNIKLSTSSTWVLLSKDRNLSLSLQPRNDVLTKVVSRHPETMCLLYRALSVCLSLSLILCLVSLSYYLSLQPRRQKPFLPQNICCIKHPPNSSFHKIYIVIAACFSSMLCFLPLFLQIILSLFLFLHPYEPAEAEHSFTLKLGCRRFLESSKKSRRAASITEQMMFPISPPYIMSLCFIAMAWKLLGNRSKFYATLLHCHNIPSNSFQTWLL